MRMIADTAWRVAAVAAALALSIAFMQVHVATAAHVVVIAAVLAAGGALADRFWVGALPFVAAGGYVAWFVLAGRELSGDWTWLTAAQMMVVIASVPALGLLAGVALRRAAASHRARDDRPGRAVAA